MAAGAEASVPNKADAHNLRPLQKYPLRRISALCAARSLSLVYDMSAFTMLAATFAALLRQESASTSGTFAKDSGCFLSFAVSLILRKVNRCGCMIYIFAVQSGEDSAKAVMEETIACCMDKKILQTLAGMYRDLLYFLPF